MARPPTPAPGPCNGRGKDRTGLAARFQRVLDRIVPEAARRGPWIAGLSAGPDSTALCALLAEVRAVPERRGTAVPEVIALHVHHGLRRRDADADAALAERTAATLGFPFRCIRLAPPETITASPEAWARSARFRAYREVAAETGAAAVLTGHHRDDQAETVLQRLARGAELRGLAAIRPCRPLYWGAEVALLRPLLGFTRAELEAYLASRGLPCARDAMNRDPRFQRNRVRLVLLPALERACPGADPRADLCAVAEAAREITDALDAAAEAILPRLTVPPPTPPRIFAPFPQPAGTAPLSPPLVLDRASVGALHPLLRPALIAAAARRLLGPGGDRFSRHAHRALARLLAEPRSGRERDRPSAVRLHAGLDLALRGDRLELRPAAPPRPVPCSTPAAPPVPLPVPGKARLPDGSRIEAERLDGPPLPWVERFRKDPLAEVVDADRIGPRLAVRPRRPGDRFHPLGAPGSCKLKRLLQEAAVPREARDRLALVTLPEEAGSAVVWVAGLRPAHPFRITGRTRHAVLLRAIPPGGGTGPGEYDPGREPRPAGT